MDRFIDKDIRDLKVSDAEAIQLQLIKEIKDLTKAVKQLYWNIEHDEV